MTRKGRPMLRGSGVPTYVRFSKNQLEEMDLVIRSGEFLNKSEIARMGVRLLLKGRCKHPGYEKWTELADGLEELSVRKDLPPDASELMIRAARILRDMENKGGSL